MLDTINPRQAFEDAKGILHKTAKAAFEANKRHQAEAHTTALYKLLMGDREMRGLDASYERSRCYAVCERLALNREEVIRILGGKT